MPARRAFSFTDPYEYHSTVRTGGVEAFLPASGNFRSQLALIELERLWMSCGEESLPAISAYRGLPHRVIVSFLANGNDPPFRHNGVEISSSEIAIDFTDTDIARLQTVGRTRWASMSLSYAELAST